MRLPFTKMHGIGNDFVVVDHLAAGAPPVETVRDAAVRLCDRQFGIGSDGILCVLPASGPGVDFQMRMFNPDGSEAEMCGNGIRCFAKYVHDRGYTDKTQVAVGTLAGTMHLALTGSGGRIESVRVDMGAPRLERAELPMTGAPGRVLDEPLTVEGRTIRLTGVSMGNPHVVYFVPEARDESINALGPAIERHPVFPRRTNVHEVQVLGPGEIKILTWERGAGRTLACGTGACACGVASALNQRTGRRVLAHLPGGDLLIDWADDGHVYMTGPAAEVFTGEIEL